MNVLRWEDPPPDRRGKAHPTSKYEPIAAALRARPGEWAIVCETSAGTAGAMTTRINGGRLPYGPAGAFEAVSRKEGEIAKVYARYVGEVVPGRSEP